MPSVAVIGPGAIGGAISTLLAARPDIDLTVCARRPVGRIVVDRGDRTLELEPRTALDPTEATAVDWIIITTKAYAALATARWFPALVGPATTVAVMQNGVEHVERFSRWLDPGLILPAIVTFGCGRDDTGLIRLPGTPGVDVPDTTGGRGLAALADGTELAVSVVDGFAAAAWRKLALNAAGGVFAMALAPAGSAHHPGVFRLVHEAAAETVAVARAAGVDLPDSVADDVAESVRSGPADAINSLHADRLAGRPMEVDARNGAVVRMGARYGIDTPVNAAIAGLLESVQPSY